MKLTENHQPSAYDISNDETNRVPQDHVVTIPYKTRDQFSSALSIPHFIRIVVFLKTRDQFSSALISFESSSSVKSSMEPATINPTMNAHDMQRQFEELWRASELKLQKQYAHMESQVADLVVQD
jgi:hypothetical protein